jgi:hypothetical protein
MQLSPCVLVLLPIHKRRGFTFDPKMGLSSIGVAIGRKRERERERERGRERKENFNTD